MESFVESSMEEMKASDSNGFPEMLHGLLPFFGKQNRLSENLEAEFQEREKNLRYHKINKKAREADWSYRLRIRHSVKVVQHLGNSFNVLRSSWHGHTMINWMSETWHCLAV